MQYDAKLALSLSQGVEAMGLSLSCGQQDKLLDYLNALIKWNRVYNLTAVRDPLEMVAKHLLDSLSLRPFVVGQQLLDVGSGAGLPGIPVAITRPDIAVTLLDSNSKKTCFLAYVKSQLQLENVTVIHHRVESFQSTIGYTTVTSRAFACLNTFVEQCGHLCDPAGEIIAMLGQAPACTEIEQLGGRVLALDPVSVPGVEGDRHIARVSAPVCASTNQL